MYAPERYQQILGQARREGRVEVAALADSLGVTKETVRRDLTTLEQRGSLHRVHGGAIPVERLEIEPGLSARRSTLTAEKRTIAARALDEIPEKGIILLDAGTTTAAIVELLPPERELTVVTNSIPAAAALSALPRVELLMIGGRVRGLTGAAVGEWSLGELAGLTVDVAFLGTNGLSVRRGLTTPDQAEGAAKHAMVRAGKRVVVVADSSKVGVDHMHRFADLGEVDLFLTDSGLAPEAAAELRSAGLEVVTA